MKKIQKYPSEGFTVTFDPNVCIHSAVCLKNLPTVFDVTKARWIRPKNEAAEAVKNVVKSCPSGALQIEA